MTDGSEKFFFCRLRGPRPTFLQDMTPEERALMLEHGAYWTERMNKGKVIVFGPVADPAGPFGMGVIRVADEAEARDFVEGDPVIRANIGFRVEILPMPRVIFPVC